MTQTTSELYDELVNKVRQYEMYISTKTLLNNIIHMENKQQTAVEWLEKELKDRYPLMQSEPFFQHAKQMEKEQIIKAASVVLWHNSSNSTETAEQYYNETYENK